MRRVRQSISASMLALSFLGVFASPAAASAAGKAAAATSAKKKVLVGRFDGAKSAEARKAVLAALKEDGAYDVGESSAKPGGDDKSYADPNASAVLVGRVKKGSLLLSVRNASDGTLVREIEVKGETSAKLNKNIADTLGVSVADALAETKSTPDAQDVASASAAPDDEKSESGSDASTTKSEGSTSAEASPYPDGHSPFEIDAGIRAIHRSFTWHDTPAELYPASKQAAPATYNLPLGPALYVAGTLYPVAFGSRGFAANVGLTGGYERNFGTSTVHDEGTAAEGKLTTTAYQYFVGVKARLPVSTHEFALLGAYGSQTYELKGDEGRPYVPDVSYKFVRVGAEARLRFDAVSVGLHVGARLVTDTGGLEKDWFPNHVKTKSVEAGVSAGYTVFPNLDLLFGLDLVRYAFDFNPISETGFSRVVAGGATDQYLSGSAGLRYSFHSNVTQ